MIASKVLGDTRAPAGTEPSSPSESAKEISPEKPEEMTEHPAQPEVAPNADGIVRLVTALLED
jgi:hypothetical protein